MPSRAYLVTFEASFRGRGRRLARRPPSFAAFHGSLAPRGASFLPGRASDGRDRRSEARKPGRGPDHAHRDPRRPGPVHRKAASFARKGNSEPPSPASSVRGHGPEARKAPLGGQNPLHAHPQLVTELASVGREDHLEASGVQRPRGHVPRWLQRQSRPPHLLRRRPHPGQHAPIARRDHEGAQPKLASVRREEQGQGLDPVVAATMAAFVHGEAIVAGGEGAGQVPDAGSEARQPERQAARGPSEGAGGVTQTQAVTSLAWGIILLYRWPR